MGEHVRESRVPLRANAPSRDYLSHRYVGLIWRGWLRPRKKLRDKCDPAEFVIDERIARFAPDVCVIEVHG